MEPHLAYDLMWQKCPKRCLMNTVSQCLTLSLPECLMEFCKVTLTFEYVDEIL